MAGKDEQGGLPSTGGPSPNSDPAASTKDATAAPKATRAKQAPAAKADPDAMAAEIERTREDLAETLDAIADKVSPKRVAKRTTKKVATAVKDTAHDAAASVKDTATTAKGKVTGAAGKSGTDWAPDPGATSELPAAAAVETPDLHLAPYSSPSVTTPTTYESTGSLVKPQYVLAGVAAALLAWLLLRKRK